VKDVNYDWRAVLKLAVGEVEVAATREAITDSEANQAIMTEILQEAQTEISDYITEHTANTKSPAEFFAACTQIQFITNLSRFTRDDYGITTGYALKGSRHIIYGGKLKDTSYTIASYYTKSGNFKDEKLFRTKPHGIPLDFIEKKACFINDLAESRVKENRRIRKFLENNPRSGVLVLEQGENQKKRDFNKVVKEFGVRKLSSLPLPPPEKRTAGSKRIPSAKSVTIHEVVQNNSYRSKSNTLRNATAIQLGTNTDKFVYFEMEGKKLPHGPSEVLAAAQFIKKKGYRLCGITKSGLKKIKGNKNFIPVSTYFTKHFKFLPDEISGMMHNAARNQEAFKLIRYSMADIESPFIQKMGALYATFSSGSVRSSGVPSLIGKFVTVHPKLEKFKEDDQALSDLIKEKLPLFELLARYSYYSNKSETFYTDLITYINSKEDQK